MKKTLLFSSAAIFLGLVVGGNVVSAAEVDSKDTKGKIEFEVDSSQASLRIDRVSEFNFGKQVVTASTETYYAALDDGTDPLSVEVTDIRGERLGWTLSVKQEEQLTATNGGDQVVLEGAKLDIANGVLTGTATGNNNMPSTVATSIDLTPGMTSKPVIVAEVNQGQGAWKYSFGADETEGAESVSLEVPASAVRLTGVEYETTLTWILADVPTP